MTRTDHRKAETAVFFLMISLISALSAVFFTSCNPAVVLTVKPDSSGRAAFTAEASPSADSIIRRFTGASAGSNENAPIFDRKSITVSLAHAGLRAESVEIPSKSSLALGVSFSKLDGILAKAVTFDKDIKRITVQLNKSILNAALDIMPADTRNYTDLLMAPVFTGEELSPSEYESTIAAAYGKTLAGDLKKSVFTLTIHCPETVKRTGSSPEAKTKSTGSTAVVTIPLSALLSLREPITAFAEW